MPADSRAQLCAFLRHRRATLARLRRVNEALSCAALKELQRMLGDVLGELEAAWERRN